MEDVISLRILYRRVMHLALFILIFSVEIVKSGGNIVMGLLALTFVLVCTFIGKPLYESATDEFYISDSYKAFLIIEMILNNIFQMLFMKDFYIVVGFLLCNIYYAYEYLINENMFDRSNQTAKKLIVAVPAAVNVIVKFSNSESEDATYTYLAFQFLAALIVFYMSDLYVRQNAKNENILSKITLEKDDMERVNEQLMEYQDKIKAVNEQINYQKIDLSRAISELERVNAESKSQTEVMKYMASTFNITKCMSVIADAVMDIRKAKICALFVDGKTFMSKYPSVVVNTNYTSMQGRLEKEFERIFKDVSENKEEAMIYKGESLKRFKFIGEANICTLAVLPIDDGERIYGVMLVGSDKEDYFEKGLAYFETSLAELNIAVKSIRLYLQMQDMARKDGLTGIYNRIYFKELFKNASDEAVSKNTPLSVALFDIDKFKSVNDTYGHLAGDEVIKMVAKTGERYAERYNGFACRYGGEEFLLVLPGYDEKQALAVLEEMHKEIKATDVVYNDIKISVNCCIGLSSYPSICKNTDLLVSRSDKAMYYGKKNGRGRLVVDNPAVDEVE